MFLALLLQQAAVFQLDWFVTAGALLVLFVLTLVQYWVFSGDEEPFNKAVIRRALTSAVGALSSGALLLPQLAPDADGMSKFLAGMGAAAMWWLGAQFFQKLNAKNAPVSEPAKQVIAAATAAATDAAKKEAHSQGFDDIARKQLEGAIKRTIGGAIKKIL